VALKHRMRMVTLVIQKPYFLFLVVSI